MKREGLISIITDWKICLDRNPNESQGTIVSWRGSWLQHRHSSSKWWFVGKTVCYMWCREDCFISLCAEGKDTNMCIGMKSCLAPRNSFQFIHHHPPPPGNIYLICGAKLKLAQTGYRWSCAIFQWYSIADCYLNDWEWLMLNHLFPSWLWLLSLPSMSGTACCYKHPYTHPPPPPSSLSFPPWGFCRASMPLVLLLIPLGVVA